MTKYRMIPLLLALAVLMSLCACGDAVNSDSDVEGIATFGAEIDPSATPAQGETIPGQEPAVRPSGSSSGVITEYNSGSTPASAEPSASDSVTSGGSAGTGTNSGTGTSGNGTAADASGTGTSGNGSSSGSGIQNATGDTQVTGSPAVSPPAAASTATPEEVQPYIGQSLRSLIEDLGYPQRSEYEDVDEDDPNTDRIGTLYFDGFIVFTLRDKDGETVTGIQVDDPSLTGRFDP